MVEGAITTEGDREAKSRNTMAAPLIMDHGGNKWNASIFSATSLRSTRVVDFQKKWKPEANRLRTTLQGGRSTRATGFS